MVRRHRCSPRLAYHIILHFITRWNIERARKYRGRADGIYSFDQASLEAVNAESTKWGHVMFPMRMTSDYAGSTFFLIDDLIRGISYNFSFSLF